MPSATEKPAVSTKELWAGRIISGLVIAFMLFDGVIHLMKIAPVVQAFQQLGWPISMAFLLGIIELLCVVIYLYPRTAMVGAIVLTGYLGGAVVTQLRVGNPLFGETLFPVYVGILAWGGLYLREPRLRTLIPFLKTQPTADVSRKMLWAGRIISALPALGILFGSIVKLIKAPAVVQGFAKAGFPEHLVIVVGIIEFLCVVIYLIPRTAVLGAILMIGLMGGATATNVRVGDPSMIITLLFGILVWAGLFLRKAELRALIPLRS
ncbi:MAG TPA: DoxX family protein [Candidatus Angelobacter sp.]